MDMRAARARVVIGEWTADPAANVLTRGREVARIEPKAMDVLMRLASRAGEVVSREELFTAAWPGTVVGDEALSQCITKLRRALGDDPRSPAYIETIPKRGYRLLATVWPEGVPRTEEASTSSGRRRLPIGGWVAAALLAVALAGGYFLLTLPTPVAPEARGGDGEPQAGWVPVTVLPFESLGPAGEQAYLARGISDNLAADLARLSGLRVIRSSDATAAGARAARYVVSGSVQRQGGTLRVNVDLVDAQTRQQLWSERFERPFGDLFAVQDDIIERLTSSLPARLSHAERQRLSKRYTRSLEAYDHFLRAQELFLARGPIENQAARDSYRKALELDPKFARAYAGLAMSYAMEYRLQPDAGSRPPLERAFELAESARLIDPDLPEVHWAIGFVHAQSRRHEQALASLRRAIELNPSFADAYALMAGIHTYRGQPEQSIPLARTALRFNPEGGYLYYLVLGRAYLFLDDTEQALINLRQALARNPADLETRVLVAATLAATGERAAATWEAEEIRSLDPGFSPRRWLDSYPMTNPRQQARIAELLSIAGL